MGTQQEGKECRCGRDDKEYVMREVYKDKTGRKKEGNMFYCSPCILGPSGLGKLSKRT